MRLRWMVVGLSVASVVVLPATAANAGGGDHAAAAGGGGGSQCEGFASGSVVEMRDNCFAGTAHFADVGELTVTNEGEQPHNLTTVGAGFATADLASAGRETISIAEAGIYRVYCTIHGTADGAGMAGVLIVGDASTEAAIADAQLASASGGGGGDDIATVAGLDALDALLIAAVAAIGAGVGGAAAWGAVRRRQGVAASRE